MHGIALRLAKAQVAAYTGGIWPGKLPYPPRRVKCNFQSRIGTGFAMFSVIAISVIGVVLAGFGLLARSPQSTDRFFHRLKGRICRRLGLLGIRLSIASALTAAALESSEVAIAATLVGIGSVICWVLSLPDGDNRTQGIRRLRS